MDRRDFLKQIGIGIAIGEMHTLPILEGLDLPKMEQVDLSPMWVRSMHLRSEYDMSRQADKYLLSIRYAPLKDWSRHQITFKKHALGFYLPKDTPTPGLNALSLLMQGIRHAD